MTWRQFHDGQVVQEWTDLPATETAARATVRKQILTDVEAALVVNRQLALQNQAIIDGAQTIEDFAGTTLTQAQIIATLKQLAQGVRVLAEHDQIALTQRNYLGRLAAGLYDGTD